MHEIAELERDYWAISGVDLSLWQGEPVIDICASDRQPHYIENNDGIDVLAETLGEVPVTAVRLKRFSLASSWATPHHCEIDTTPMKVQGEL